MHLFYNNVNDAFAGIVKGFMTSRFQDDPDQDQSTETTDECMRSSLRQGCPHYAPISRSPSRYGEVLVVNEPVTITYRHPLHRVLFNPYRDCNPFFHLVESLWMLAGRNDVATLKHYIKNFDKFSDDGTTIHDAYGYRWRQYFHHSQSDHNQPDQSDNLPPVQHQPSDQPVQHQPFGQPFDQIETVIKILRRERMGRRVVLQMWSPDDLDRVFKMPGCKAVPCNLCIMFLPRRETIAAPTPTSANMETVEVLDMTVINRSNDTILGALGANYVHMTFLFEYICLATGFKVGRYHQITNNLHVYIGRNGSWTPPFDWEPQKLLDANTDEYNTSLAYPPRLPLWFGRNRTVFDYETRLLLAHTTNLIDINYCTNLTDVSYCPTETPILRDLFHPAIAAFNLYKQGHYKEAIDAASSIVPFDWRIACTQWLCRRYAKSIKGHPVSLMNSPPPNSDELTAP